jgi:methanogenic corrinoid protein MtbC1
VTTSHVPTDAAPDVDGLRARYVEAQLQGDRRAALGLVMHALERGASPDRLRDRVVREAQREIGRLWQENRISVADEHVATAISHLVLAHLYDRARPGRPVGKKVMVACVDGELHELPARLVADELELAGFDVRFLGASVPTRHLLENVAKEKPDLLALSITMSFHVTALAEAIAAVRASAPGLPIAIGGHACTWSDDLARRSGADAFAGDASGLVDQARKLLRVAS